MNVTRLMIDSVTNPRETARHLMDANPALALRWQGLVLVTVLSTVLPLVALYVASDATRAEVAASNPVLLATAQLGINTLTVVLMQGIGQLARGKGRFVDALLLVAWMQAVLLVVQVVQSAAIVLMPGLALPILAVGVVLFFWMLSHFTAELHGFQSALRVFGVLFGLLFLLGLAISPLVAPFMPSGG